MQFLENKVCVLFKIMFFRFVVVKAKFQEDLQTFKLRERLVSRVRLAGLQSPQQPKCLTFVIYSLGAVL